MSRSRPALTNENRLYICSLIPTNPDQTYLHIDLVRSRDCILALYFEVVPEYHGSDPVPDAISFTYLHHATMGDLRNCCAAACYKSGITINQAMRQQIRAACNEVLGIINTRINMPITK